MDSLSLIGQTLLKTHPIAPHSIAHLQDRKKDLMAIAQPRAIHFYNIDSAKFEDELKIGDRSGSISCLTVSDDLVFFACGMSIGAAGCNAKVIFQFDTYMASDRIDILFVSGYRLWMVSGNLLNEFALGGAQLNNKKSRKGASPHSKTEDAHSHVFQSKVNSGALVEEELEKPYLVLLKNSNQIVVYDAKELCTLKTSSPPVALAKYQQHNQFIVGTMSGQILLIETSRKQIKLVWSVKEESVGAISCLVEGKNGNFIVFRDESMEIWAADRTMLGSQEMREKITSVSYSEERDLAVVGSSSGLIIQMTDYVQMMKNYQAKNQAKNKEGLEREIADLRRELQALKLKAKSSNKKTNASVGISAQIEINLDYTNTCYSLDISSESKISKIIIKGDLTVLHSPKTVFSGKEDTLSVYVLEEEGVTSSKIPFKIEEAYHQNLKMRVIVYGIRDGEMYGISKILSIKPMSLHHKVAPAALGNHNSMRINGGFKYFEMNAWLNTVFNDFGASGESGEVFTEVFYESLVTKNLVCIKYKNGECLVLAENPAPLIIVKKLLIEKAKEKHTSLNFSTELSLDSVKNLVASLELKRKAELLPGLMELKNDDSLSGELREVLEQREDILKKLESSRGQHEALMEQMRGCLVAYRALKERETNKFEMDALERAMEEFEEEKICKLILE